MPGPLGTGSLGAAATPASLAALTEAFARLPGIGPKTAQRMALHLLQHDRAGAELLGRSLLEAVSRLGHCQSCNTFSESETCELCRDDGRDASLLCVVETPADLMVMEQTQSFKGHYFVLMGRLSPLDGIGPKDIHLDRLLSRAADGQVNEVIVATNFTVEGEATAHFTAEMLTARGIRVSRIARGLPVGGELEHVDSGTLAQAVIERRQMGSTP